MVRTVGVRPTTFRLKVENSIAELRAYMVLRAGFGPATYGLRDRSSTTELPEYIGNPTGS